MPLILRTIPMKFYVKQPFDDELLSVLVPRLLVRHHNDGIMQGFLVLTERLRFTFQQAKSLDGIELVNKIFGKNSKITFSKEYSNKIDSIRDLLSGLYGVIRNKYMHSKVEPNGAEFSATIEMLNYILINLDKMRLRQEDNSKNNEN